MEIKETKLNALELHRKMTERRQRVILLTHRRDLKQGSEDARKVSPPDKILHKEFGKKGS